ncbi:MAG: hypothetical protein JXA92_00025 [candidate division Zixibacteria bacterium]|nr:hypothetical protein [candidate division Zixibacteria bacterium]
MSKILICLLFLSLSGGLLSAADTTDVKPVEYFSPPNLLRFADYLYETGDYLRAAGEYRRYLFSVNGGENTDDVYYRMIRALFIGEDYRRCRELLGNFEKEYPGSTRVPSLPLYESVIEFRQNEYELSLTRAVRTEAGDRALRNRLVAANYIMLGEYPEAAKIACAPETPGYNADWCRRLENIDTLPFKSKFLSGTMSALVPGLGKIYCKRTADGVYSLILVGLSAWQAYDGFEEDGTESVKGWLLGTIGAVFYLGNIYGSVIAAELYNYRVKDDFVQGFRIDITLP